MHGKIARYPPCGPYLAPGPEILTDLRGAFQTMWGKLGAQGWGRPRKLSASADSGFKVLRSLTGNQWFHTMLRNICRRGCMWLRQLLINSTTAVVGRSRKYQAHRNVRPNACATGGRGSETHCYCKINCPKCMPHLG